MIVEIIYNKQTKVKIKQEYLELYKKWFNDNKEVWILGRVLEAELKTTGVRKYVNKLRNTGMPIISDTKLGYKYSTNKKELTKCYNKLRDRALRTLSACQKMRKHL